MEEERTLSILPSSSLIHRGEGSTIDWHHEHAPPADNGFWSRGAESQTNEGEEIKIRGVADDEDKEFHSTGTTPSPSLR